MARNMLYECLLLYDPAGDIACIPKEGLEIFVDLLSGEGIMLFFFFFLVSSKNQGGELPTFFLSGSLCHGEKLSGPKF